MRGLGSCVPDAPLTNEANEATNRVFKAKIKIMDIMKKRPDVVNSLLSYAEDKVSNYTKAHPNNKPTDDVRWPNCRSTGGRSISRRIAPVLG